MDFPLLNLAIALGLGLLVGLQRERAASLIAGIRTFPLVTLFGAVCGHFAATGGGGIVLASGVVAVAVLLWIGNLPGSGPPTDDPGLTTEVALLVMYGVGALAGHGERTLAVVLGATTAVLLHLRPELHAFAARIADVEMRAVMQFVVVALIVLPVLPEGHWGPLGVINPRQVWWMVVLITGISLVSYLAYQWLGDRGGAIAAGILGGLISSTATTAATARGTRAAAGHSPALALLVIQIASTVVFARVLVLVAMAAPDQFLRIAPLPAAMLVLMTAAAAGVGWRIRGRDIPRPPASNPAELRLALTFAALFVLVLLAVAAAKERFGVGGLYGVAVLSGLTDMDAITLSTAQLAQHGKLDPRIAGRVILVASLANLVFKAGAVAVLGSRGLARRVALLFGSAVAAGALMILLAG